jgi:hypothetical protein
VQNARLPVDNDDRSWLRGCGPAIYGDESTGLSKKTVQSGALDLEGAGFDFALSEAVGDALSIRVISTRAILSCPAGGFEDGRAALSGLRPYVGIMS